MTLKQLQQMAKENDVEFIDLKFSDLLGRWRHISLPVEALDNKLLTQGVGVDGSSVTGFAKVKSGDMILLPDTTTAFIDPFFDHPTLSMIGDVVEVEEEIFPFDRNPRSIAAHAEKYMKDSKIAEDSLWGPEFEFYLFSNVLFRTTSESAYHFVDSPEAEWNAGEDDPNNYGYQIPYKKGYHAAPPSDQTYGLRCEMSAMMKKLGIEVKYHHHEVGGASQEEIELKFGTLLKMADKAMLTKYIIKNIAMRYGLSATFMPKPLYNEPGSGWHVHQYLTKGGKSLFFEKGKPSNLSDIGRFYIGGLLKHAPALLCFTNPSTNSYKRLVPGFEAPVRGTYSTGNRSAAIRIPGYQLDPKTFRMEFRPPDATCNPYLAFAAMLMAGVDGIKNKIDPGEEVNKDIATMPKRELKKIPMLPTSLSHAIEALRRDHAFLMEGEVFSKDTIEHWIELKQAESDEIRVRPHPHEFSLYYNC